MRQALFDTIVISMTPTQSRMARAALKWSLSDLADAAGVGRATAARFELGEAVAPASIAAMRSAGLAGFWDAMISIHGEMQAVANGESDKANNPLKYAPHTAKVVCAESRAGSFRVART